MPNAHTLITCHANADFDSLAAMIAVRHFHNQPLLLFPGTQESRLKNYFDKLPKSIYGFVDAEEVPWEEIRTLVVVDTRQPGRVPHVRALLERDDVTVLVYDHHPKTSSDFANATIHDCTFGAVTSLLVLALKDKNIAIPSSEATLLALGIYEDTGAFTYTSTSAEDFLAAAWLAAQGMDLDEIAELEMQQLNGMQIRLLNELIESSQAYRINGQEVIIAEISLDEYLCDCAFLAYQLMEMGRHQVVFVLCQLADRIQVIARSKTASINVGDICALLGGGGHAYAASASVKNLLLPTVKDTILRQLQFQKAPPKTVRAYMSTPPIGVQTTTLIREADEMLFHFGLKSLPVYYPGTHKLAGIFDVQTATRAMNHKLSNVCVEEYMQSAVRTIAPDSSLREAARIIINNNQRMVPIIESDEVIGVLTRTDLVNLFAEISIAPPSRAPKYYNVEKLLQERLPKTLLDILQKAGAVGHELDIAVYVVGGFVRDLLLQVPNHDIDLVVEENCTRFALRLAEILHGRVSKHTKFMTAIVIFHDQDGQELKIDVATARLEYYEHPAALPLVEVSPIKMDLARRDFTINALAIRLDKESDHLVDFFGGQRDLKDQVIRVLHTLSFVEDPTRCLRAVRFEQRFGFRLGKNTEKLIKNAVHLKVLDQITHQRMLHEFTELCHEKNPCACIVRLEELGICKEIFPKTVLTKKKKELLLRLDTFITWYQMLYQEEEIEPLILYLWCLNDGLNYVDVKENLAKLHLTGPLLDAILTKRVQLPFLLQKITQWGNEPILRLSSLYLLLAPVDMNGILFLLASNKNEALSPYLSKYVTELRKMRPDISGKDLLDKGIEPGPIYKQILERVLLAKLDNEAPDRASQLALALSLAQTLPIEAPVESRRKKRKNPKEQPKT